jgi:hypothetical protein
MCDALTEQAFLDLCGSYVPKEKVRERETAYIKHNFPFSPHITPLHTYTTIYSPISPLFSIIQQAIHIKQSPIN